MTGGEVSGRGVGGGGAATGWVSVCVCGGRVAALRSEDRLRFLRPGIWRWGMRGWGDRPGNLWAPGLFEQG